MRVFCAYIKCFFGFLITGTGFVLFIRDFFVSEWHWSYVVTFFVTWLVIASGITVGFHRYATHRSFSFTGVGKWLVRPLYLLAGSFAFQSNMFFWVAAHHRHHQHTDQEGDPHSPCCEEGGFWKGVWHFLWAHMFWIPHFNPYEKELPQWSRFDWLERLIVRLYLPIVLAPLVLIWYFMGWHYLAAYLAAVFVNWHMTSSVNSVAHLFGNRPHKTKDNSRNIFWLAVLSLGEHLHQNHHKAQKSARLARTWWEHIADTGWLQICLLRLMGLVRSSAPS